ncbi:KxYKxGKxW signal peptide domain-containing protein [Lactococcus termiticola]|uniref:Hemagglutinin n=1 Tax=Lactococcus termiticola TaxID=2169526 RepID=A0A2R5HKZ8_9LACT|nr:KxYKxGKxW signal peptide domain-containing protein [Lactococcus termiticola]GBG97411.1 hemagglutinin [Lactococcus termiticola]
MSKKTVNRHEEIKLHYRMYKRKKGWLYAAIGTVSGVLGGVLVEAAIEVSAEETMGMKDGLDRIPASSELARTRLSGTSAGLIAPGDKLDTGNHKLDNLQLGTATNYRLFGNNDLTTFNNMIRLVQNKTNQIGIGLPPAALDTRESFSISANLVIAGNDNWHRGDFLGLVFTGVSEEDFLNGASSRNSYHLGIQGLPNSYFIGRDLWYHDALNHGPAVDGNEAKYKPSEEMVIRKTDSSGNLVYADYDSQNQLDTTNGQAWQSASDFTYTNGVASTGKGANQPYTVRWTPTTVNADNTVTGTMSFNLIASTTMNGKNPVNGGPSGMTIQTVMTLPVSTRYAWMGGVGDLNPGWLSVQMDPTKPGTGSRAMAPVQVNFVNSKTGKPLAGHPPASIMANVGDKVRVSDLSSRSTRSADMSTTYNYTAIQALDANLTYKSDQPDNTITVQDATASNASPNVINVQYESSEEEASLSYSWASDTPGYNSNPGQLQGSLPDAESFSGNVGVIPGFTGAGLPAGYSIQSVTGPDGKSYASLAEAESANPINKTGNAFQAVLTADAATISLTTSLLGSVPVEKSFNQPVGSPIDVGNWADSYTDAQGIVWNSVVNVTSADGTVTTFGDAGKSSGMTTYSGYYQAGTMQIDVGYVMSQPSSLSLSESQSRSESMSELVSQSLSSSTSLSLSASMSGSVSAQLSEEVSLSESASLSTSLSTSLSNSSSLSVWASESLSSSLSNSESEVASASNSVSLSSSLSAEDSREASLSHSVSLSLSQSESISGSVSGSASLSSSMSLSLSLSDSQRLSDQLSISNSQSTLLSESLSASSSTSLSTSISDSSSIQASQSLSASLSASDSKEASESSSLSTSISESSSLSESASELLSQSRSLSEQLSASLSTSSSTSLSLSLSHSNSTSEEVSLSQSLSSSVSESRSISGSVSESESISNSISVSESISESTSLSASHSNYLSTSLSTSLSASSSTSLSISLSDSNSARVSQSLSESLSRSESKETSEQASISASNSLSESASELLSQSQSLSEQFSSSNSLSDSVSQSTSLSESQSLSEELSVSASGSLSTSSSTSLSLSDSSSTEASQSLSESVSLSEEVSLSQSSSSSVAESESTSGSLSEFLSSSIAVSESLSMSTSLSDSHSTSVSASRSLSLSISTSLSSSASQSASFSELMSGSSSLSNSLSSSLSLSLSDSMQTSQSLSDSLSLSEAVSLSQSASKSVSESESVSRSVSDLESQSSSISESESASASISETFSISGSVSESLSRSLSLGAYL